MRHFFFLFGQVWGLDSTLYPGQCCNDVELIVMGLFMLKQQGEAEGAAFFPDAANPDLIACMHQVLDIFDIDTALDVLTPLYIRPFVKSFSDKAMASGKETGNVPFWWTYTNKGRTGSSSC